ncbi:MAG: hypothetical protein ABIN58_11135 [candidate division WOR-3 bacterium]
MADTVKTGVLKALEEALGAVSALGQIIRNPSKPVDQETARFPLAFVFDEEESKRQVNRYALVTMPVQIEVWMRTGEADISDAADEIAAAIEQTLLSSATVALRCQDIRPDPERSVVKFYADEFLGGCVLRYIVQYRHVWGDPYDAGARKGGTS